LNNTIQEHNIILDHIQYKFPLSPQPYLDIATQLDMKLEDLIEILGKLHNNGIIKRIGFTINYRSFGIVSSLVAFKLDPKLIPKFSKKLKEDSSVKHNYVRNHKTYNIWFTTRAKNDNEILQNIKALAEEFKVKDYIILKSLKTYKLSVKYDLHKGISWSIPKKILKSADNFSEYGLNTRVLRKLRSLPLRTKPYKEIAERSGYKEEELLDILREMVKDGVILDYGGILNGEKIGFKYNCMVTFKGDESICKKLLKTAFEATHIVLRQTIHGNWDKNVYFMIHGIRRDTVEKRINEIMKSLNVDYYLKIYSLARLK